MQKIQRVTVSSEPSTLCDSLGEDYQRKQKVRAVIVSATVLGMPRRFKGCQLKLHLFYAYRDDFVCRKLGAA